MSAAIPELSLVVLVGASGSGKSSFGDQVRFLPVGPEDPVVGAPTQMGVFERSGL